MNKTAMITLIVTILMIHSVRAYMINSTTKYEFEAGRWENQTISFEQDNEDTTKPSAWFVCGWRTREQIWRKEVPNCDCRWGFIDGNVGWRCKMCLNEFRTKTSGFEFTYCSYTNWNDQIKKTYETNSPNAGEWRKATTCPYNTYARGIQFKYGTQYQEPLYVVSITGQCPTIQFNNGGEKVTDDFKIQQTKMFKPNVGQFLSSLKIKSIPDGPITGIIANFESVPIVSKIIFTYSNIPDADIQPVSIDKTVLQNCANKETQFTVSFTKSKQYRSIYRTDENFIKNYKIVESVAKNVEQPKAKQITIGSTSNYTLKSTTFSFGNQTITTLSSSVTFKTLVSPKTTVSYNTMIREQPTDIYYTAQVFLVNIINEKPIRNYKVAGKWSGVLLSEARTRVNQQVISCNLQKNS